MVGFLLHPRSRTLVLPQGFPLERGIRCLVRSYSLDPMGLILMSGFVALQIGVVTCASGRPLLEEDLSQRKACVDSREIAVYFAKSL